MLKTFTCIRCPNGCEVVVDTQSFETRGNLCPKGAEYAREELTGPMRTIASSMLVEGGDHPLVSVRLSKPVPKARIFPVMEGEGPGPGQGGNGVDSRRAGSR